MARTALPRPLSLRVYLIQDTGCSLYLPHQLLGILAMCLGLGCEGADDC
jgi:hypothetical protein